jgi:hypothetical protein
MHDPPDVEQIDWEAVKRDLHNALLEAGLVTIEDVSHQQVGVTSVILGVMRRRVVALYLRTKETI